MGSIPRNSKFSLRRNPRKLRGRRWLRARALRAQRSNTGVRSTCKYSSKVLSGKLEALRNLIPTHNGNADEVVKADRLFEETADYILKLRIQVFVLQRLVEFYGSSCAGEGGNVCNGTL